MITLLFDSSDNRLSVGIADDTKLIESTTYECWQTQSEEMIPEIKKLMDKYGYTRKDIKDVVVGIGPGSYTGIRISITIAKTIGLALSCPVYPISSLQILKDFDKPSICILNARSKRSYVGVYQNEKCLFKDQILTNEELLDYIKLHNDYSLCGDLKYLNLEGVVTNPIEQMFSVKKYLVKAEDNLTIKPVYLKEEYAPVKY